MSEPLIIKLRTLTPLWTGGVDGTSERLHVTGIMGSLRWWYEALVRGLGGDACDPSQDGCIYDPDKLNNGLCNVCQLFGATGWRRRFRLKVAEDNTKPAWNPPPDMLNVRPPDRTRGWYLPPGQMGTFTLRFDGDDEILQELAALFLFLERWGGLGAKPQLGYGVVEIENRDAVRERVADWRWEAVGAENPNKKNLPDLRHFGFFRYRFQPEKPGWWTRVPGIERVVTRVQFIVKRHKMVPLAPALKNEWRFHRWTGSRDDAKKIFGSLRPKRIRSKVAVSWAYPQNDSWEVRGWAWLHNDEIAKRMWDLLRDEKGWQAAIPARGRLETYPDGQWRVWTIEEVATFLEGTK